MTDKKEINASQAGMRLDRFLVGIFPDFTRSQLQKHVANLGVLVNQKPCKVGYALRSGDLLDVLPMQPRTSLLTPKPMPLAILYEDDDIIVLNKPAGLTVHPGAGTGNQATLVEGLLAYTQGSLGQSSGKNAWLRPGLVHRLDRDTTGVLVCAKNDQSLFSLSQQFAKHSHERSYLALLAGTVPNPIAVESYLYRDPKNRLRFASLTPQEYAEFVKAKPNCKTTFRWSKSIFEPIKFFANRLTLCKVKLVTGRTHQIRIHSRELKAPIVGDSLYNQKKVFHNFMHNPAETAVMSASRQMLHAEYIGFFHPADGRRLEFTAPLPEDFSSLLSLLTL